MEHRIVRLAVAITLIGLTACDDEPSEMNQESNVSSTSPSSALVTTLDPTTTVSTPDNAAASVVPLWAGDHSMPPDVVISGRTEIVLRPWTWGWTSPPNERGEQESVVADGIPPDPLDVVVHDGSVDLRYPLPGWTFTARLNGGESILPIDTVDEGDIVGRIDVSATVDGDEIWLVGTAAPGYYELNVTFAVTRDPAPDRTHGGDEQQVGVGSFGPPLVAPTPWVIDTIDSDVEPGALVVEFSPPPPCGGAEATATVGRGGALLVSLWVDSAPTGDSCSDDGLRNRVTVQLTEPIGDRQVYTTTIADTGGASAPAEQLADSIIGLPVAEAREMIAGAGFETRDVTGLEEVEDSFDRGRINIWTSDGRIDFATVG